MLTYIYCLIVFFAVALGGLLGDRFWWLAVINSMRYWLFLPAPLLLINNVFHPTGRRRSFLLLLLIASWFWLYFPFDRESNQQESQRQDSANIVASLMTFNVLAQNDELGALAKVVLEEQPDILCLQEIRKKSAKYLAKLYEYKSFADSSEISDLAVLSRYPLSKLAEGFTVNGHFQVVRVKFKDKNLHLINLHTRSPNPWDMLSSDRREIFVQRYSSQETLLSEALNKSKDLGLDKVDIIAGDFNSTEGNNTYRQLHKSDYIEAYRQVNPIFPHKSFTFPAMLIKEGNASQPEQKIKLMPFLKIDHIFLHKNLKPLRSNIVYKHTGSDHNPLITLFAFN